MQTLKLNQKFYKMDTETAELFIELLSRAIRLNDYSAVWAILILGQQSGRITEVQNGTD
jgi:hypothetical protein